MSEVFGHKYELYVKLPNELIDKHKVVGECQAPLPTLSGSEYVKNYYTYSDISSVTGYKVPESDYTTIAKDTVLITNPIQMTADIEYGNNSSTSSSQTATIKLYNLSKETLGNIKKNSALLLKAGYESDSDLPVLFVGTVEKVSTKPEGQDKVTEIQCKEGGNVLKTVIFQKKFPKGTLFLSAFITIMDAFASNGIPTGNFYGNADSLKEIQETLNISGTLESALTELCGMLKFVWFISGGKLFVQPRDEDRVVDVVKVYPQNVIGSIYINDDSNATSVINKDDQSTGVNFKGYLNPSIRLETYIEITYGDYVGTYKPSKIKHNLDWFNGPWQTTIEAMPAKNFQLQRTI